PTLTLPLAAPAAQLEPGDTVRVYLPGRPDPVVTGARVLATPVTSGAVPTVEVTLAVGDVGQLVQHMAPDVGGRTGFVVVGEE
ncbi:MAG: hypothetical protein L0H93_22490, partial [Nocardioides sp.]|nr:hypothetical protein [Nocardioides sp.]